MTQYFTNFSEYSTGIQPSDWTERFNTGNAATTVEPGGDFGGQVLTIDMSSDSRYMISWDEIDGDSNRDDFEILMRVQCTGGTQNNAAVSAGGRGSGGAGTETLYSGWLWMNAVPHNHIRKYNGGASSQLAADSVSWSLNTWYWIRFQVIGTALKMKRWSGDVLSEPGAWDLETTDPDLSSAGWVGVFSFSAESDPYEVDWFGVGTNGDAAPGPRKVKQIRTHRPRPFAPGLAR